MGGHSTSEHLGTISLRLLILCLVLFYWFSVNLKDLRQILLLLLREFDRINPHWFSDDFEIEVK